MAASTRLWGVDLSLSRARNEASASQAATAACSLGSNGAYRASFTTGPKTEIQVAMVLASSVDP
jgi:hypothetical protein